jgi:hypothetical protein
MANEPEHTVEQTSYSDSQSNSRAQRRIDDGGISYNHGCQSCCRADSDSILDYHLSDLQYNGVRRVQ